MAGHPLAEAFMANRGALLRYLRARGAGDEAEDLLQELWLRIGDVDSARDDGGDLRGIGNSAIVDSIAYVYRMAHNLMLDRFRAAQRRRARESVYGHGGEAIATGPNEAPQVERALFAREQLRQVTRVLAGLGARTDHVFRRYRLDGVAQRDIAAELGISLSAVEKHLQRAYRAVAHAQRAFAADGDATTDADASGGDAPAIEEGGHAPR